MKSTLHGVGRRIGALAALLLCGSVLVWAATKGPDAGGYTATDETVYSFVDIAGASGGASMLSSTDDGTAVLTLPFPFEFYGQSYSLSCVSTNGAVYFVPTVAACGGFDGDFANTDLTAAPVPNDRPAILPFWTDLTFQASGAGAVLYQTLGTAPNRRFVIQWNNAYPQGSPNPVTFEVILSERNSQILFQYKTVALGAGNPSHNGATATVGIRNAGSLTSHQQLQWSVNVPVLADEVALLFLNSSRDTTPPAVTAVATPSVLWPPNGKTVLVKVQGTISDAGGLAGARFAVTDQYGLVQPTGSITVAPNGTYTATVPLVADRRGTDLAGRKYTIIVTATDTAGNEGSARAIVTVPHDQGK